jgi:alanine racemase
MPVKADAYGHGASPLAAAGILNGADFLAVARVQEGAELRRAGIAARILLLSPPVPEELGALAAYRLTPLISDRDLAGAINAAAEKAGIILPAHIKIDTGMGRIGCRPEEAADLACCIHSLKSLKYEGTATHLARADSPAPEAVEATKIQIARFKSALEVIRRAGANPGIVHAANSGAVLLHEDAYFDMVRPGILLYGYPPSEELADSPEPIMELETTVVFIKNVKKGEALSYGGTWIAPKDTAVGTLPIGYGDGLPRQISGAMRVIIRGISYPLAGRICMDQCMVDLGSADLVKRWDKVTVFGGEGSLTAADIALQAHTIPYEITCNINKRVPRVYVS